MPKYEWQCEKCAHQIKKDAPPNVSSCPKGGFHSWKQLGEVGSVEYLCDKCEAQVQTRSQPSVSNCPAGSFHHWTRL